MPVALKQASLFSSKFCIKYRSTVKGRHPAMFHINLTLLTLIAYSRLTVIVIEGGHFISYPLNCNNENGTMVRQ